MASTWEVSSGTLAEMRRGVTAAVLALIAVACADGAPASEDDRAESASAAPSTTAPTYGGPPQPLESAHISLAAEAFVNHASVLFPRRVGMNWVSDSGTTAEVLNIGIVGLTKDERMMWESSRGTVGPFADRMIVVPTTYSYDELSAYQMQVISALGSSTAVAVGIGMSSFDADAVPQIIVSGPVTPLGKARVRAVVPDDLVEFAGGPPPQLL